MAFTHDTHPGRGREGSKAWNQAERLILRQFLNRPLVEAAGNVELSERYFDAINALTQKRGAAEVVSTYDIAVMGGEPYGRWL